MEDKVIYIAHEMEIVHFIASDVICGSSQEIWTDYFK